jgi:hypothetical protein
MFKPVTNVSVDMMKSGMDMFKKMPAVDPHKVMTVPEISVSEMRKQGIFDMQDILDRVDCLNILNYPVIVSNYLRYFRVSDFLGRYTNGKVAFVLGIPNLETLFDDAYYEGLKGGILGAFAALFDRDTRLFIYPMRSPDTPAEVITADTFPVAEHLKHFYYYLQATHKILPVEKFIDANMHIWPEDVLREIEHGLGDWDTSVPEPVTREIVRRRLFGFGHRRP